jgi:hypothetical protein
MKEQTAVEWLFEQLCSEKLSWNKDSMGKLFIDLRTSNILQQAKEMEKEQRGYSEEDVIKIVEKSRETGLTAEYLLLTFKQQEL